jgi:hypothetical protein
MLALAVILGAVLSTQCVTAHVGAWAKGMYCINGPQTKEDLNSATVVLPLYQLSFEQWWMHSPCQNFPPPDGEFLDLPAGGSFKVELATNRAMTTLAFDGKYATAWPNGKTLPDDINIPTCITEPNLHTQNQSRAAGTAFAISYQSDINAVKPDNLAVFSVLEHTPWKREATYQVPAALPACPPGGCHCAWGWVPNGCGQPNMYQQPFRCRVTGATSTTPVATAQPPRWCEENQDTCVKGAKQMIYWNQASGNNIEVDGFDLNHDHKSPAYNMKLGFANGAQNDIFAGTPTEGSSNTPAQSPNPNPPASSSQGTPTSSNPPPASTDTPAPASNGTSTSCSRPRQSCRSRRSTPFKRSSIVEGVASHLKRRHSRQLF